MKVIAQLLAVLTFLMVTAVTLIFVLGSIFLVMIGLFNILNVHYESLGAVASLVLGYYLVAFILDFFLLLPLNHLFKTDSGKTSGFLMKFMIDCTGSFFALYAVDEWMDRVTIPFGVEILIVLFLFFVEMAFEDKTKGKDKKKL